MSKPQFDNDLHEAFHYIVLFLCYVQSIVMTGVIILTPIIYYKLITTPVEHEPNLLIKVLMHLMMILCFFHCLSLKVYAYKLLGWKCLYQGHIPNDHVI